MHRGESLGVLVAQHQRMIHIGGRTLQTVQDQFLQARHVFPLDLEAAGDRNRPSLVDQTFASRGWLPLGRTVDLLGRDALFAASRFVQLPRSIADTDGVHQVLLDAGRIEIDVRHRGKQRLDHKTIHLRVPLAELRSPVSVLRDTFHRVDHQIL